MLIKASTCLRLSVTVFVNEIYDFNIGLVRAPGKNNGSPPEKL